MTAQIRVNQIGVPSEKDTGISRSTVTSADPKAVEDSKTSLGSASAMRSNNMPQGRRV